MFLFLKTGKAAAETFSTAEAQIEPVKNNVRRFYISQRAIGQPYKIIFLDGELNDYGMLNNPVFWEYTLFHNGKWQTFVKPDDKEGPDPIAAQGEKPTLMQVFTIINLTPFTRKDGTVVEAHKQLFVCARSTMKRLAQMAKKHGGLTGCLFEVCRSNDRAENVGDLFEFEDKASTADLIAQFGDELVSAAKYEEVIEYRSVAELKKLGFGSR